MMSVLIQVKLWRVCDPAQDQCSDAEVTLSPADGRLELVLFHPAASELLAVASVRGLQVWDVTRDTALTGKHTPVCARFSLVFSYFTLSVHWSPVQTLNVFHEFDSGCISSFIYLFKMHLFVFLFMLIYLFLINLLCIFICFNVVFKMYFNLFFIYFKCICLFKKYLMYF